VTAAFIGLAFIAALNPKLLAVDLLFMESERPRLMFGCFLLGGMAVGLAIGLLDVFVLHADAVKSQGSVSAGVDLAVGLLLLASGALVATGRLHGRRRRATAADGQRGADGQPGGDGQPAKKDGWAQRLLGRPRPGLAVLIGAVAGTPGAAYITALHQLITGKTSTGSQALAVVVFIIIEFLLVLIPFAFLELRPEGTKARLHSMQDWLTSHARQLIVAVALIVGIYLVISALVRLL
jgi:hypothetical protein